MRRAPSFTSLLLCVSLALVHATCASAQAPAAAATTAAVGKPAPDFSLQDTAGNTVKLSALRGKTVVLEWFNPDCPFVRYAHTEGPLKDFAQRVSSDKLVWLSINSNAPGKQGHGVDRNRQAKAEYSIPNAVLLDETGKVGRAYGAIKTPHLFVIDAKGVLVYRGGLDNAPVGKVDAERPRLPGSAPNAYEPYLQNALADLGSHKALRMSDTPPYGCTVKYAD
ncbi:MAG TPA: redoxin family protein [Polyangiales bacterium]|nr:redoxin family protein [Polyangiales bacterium]